MTCGERLTWTRKRNFWQFFVTASAGYLAGDVFYIVEYGPSPASYPSGAIALAVLIGSLARVIYCARQPKGGDR